MVEKPTHARHAKTLFLRTVWFVPVAENWKPRGGFFRNRFSDALEAADDQDLRWRCTFLTAVSLAIGDKGDANAALAKATLGLQHAETFAMREGETASAARRVLNEVRLVGFVAG